MLLVGVKRNFKRNPGRGTTTSLFQDYLTSGGIQNNRRHTTNDNKDLDSIRMVEIHFE